MKVCYWGTYDKDYPRNRTLISGLRKNGVEVIECNVRIWRDTEEKMKAATSGWGSLKVLYKWLAAYAGLIKRFRDIKDIDFILIGYSGHFDVFAAKILSRLRGVPLIFDAFLSLFDSLVFDRKVVRKGSVKAGTLYRVDKYACKLADLVLLDTKQYIDYFVSEFGLDKTKFRRILIGADDRVFCPEESRKNGAAFTAIHYGKYIPLHGMPYIIKAAQQLEEHNVKFLLIGSGGEYQNITDLARKLNAKNIEFVEFTEQKKLVHYIRNADVCLGIFGDTDKAARVVPNKVYEAMAMKKPLITGDTPAAREVLEDGKNCVLCEMMNPGAIRDSILRLKNDSGLRKRIAEGAYATYKRDCSPAALGKKLVLYLESFNQQEQKR